MDATASNLNELPETGNSINPVIEKAYQEGRLSIGSVGQFYSETGITLKNKPNPVVVLYMTPPEGLFRSSPKISDQQLDIGVEPMPQFEGGEHTAIGDQVILYFYNGDPGEKAYKVPLKLPNGLKLTYGQILALGGDFYGIPDKPISDGKTESDRKQRFTNAYNTLAQKAASKSEATQILQVMQIEINAVNQALKEGKPASSAYKKLGDSLSEKWNRITGGGSPVSPWIPMGRYLKLAATNWDHFSQCAVSAYTAGHTVAMQAAVQARSIHNSSNQNLALQQAYAMNAFADHFLTDLFSSGHMRSPRKALNDHVTPSSVGGLLTRYMHDEDCDNGLYVSNKRGNQWKAYGDKRYMDMVDIKNAILVNSAAQLSANEIFQAFITGQLPTPSSFAALDIIPNLKKVQDYKNPGSNYSPMFVSANNTVIRRNDLNNPKDFSWTDNWWGSTTLAWLKAWYKGPSWSLTPMKPPESTPSIDPNGWQTDNPIPPNWVNGNNVRYCVTFVDGLNETNPGKWSSWTTLNNEFLPTLKNVPTDPSNTANARNIYREFINKIYSYVGTINNNTTTTFVDKTN